MSRRPRQRNLFWLDVNRRQARAYVYLPDGRRRRVMIATFEEARIAGVNEDGEPVHRNARDGRWSEDFLIRRWHEVRQELQSEEAERIGGGRPIREVMQDWIDTSAVERQPGTITWYVKAANTWVEANRNHRIGDLSLRHIDKLKVALSQRGLAPTTINVYLRTLKRFFRWAAERKELAEVPRIEFLAEERQAPNAPTDEEVRRLFAYLAGRVRRAEHRIAYLEARGKPASRTRLRAYLNAELAVWIAVFTGLRRAAICGLPRAAVDLDERMIHTYRLTRLASRTKRMRAVVLPQALAAKLGAHFKSYPDETYVLDDGKGNPYYRRPAALTLAIKRVFAAKEVGLAGRGIKPMHGFRALRARMLDEAGAPLALIADILGHSDVRVTIGYFPHLTRAQRELVERMDSGTGLTHSPETNLQDPEGKGGNSGAR